MTGFGELVFLGVMPRVTEGIISSDIDKDETIGIGHLSYSLKGEFAVAQPFIKMTERMQKTVVRRKYLNALRVNILYFKVLRNNLLSLIWSGYEEVKPSILNFFDELDLIKRNK